MRNRLRGLIGALAAALLVSLAAISCSPRQSAEIRIGAVLPLTGSAAVWGQNSQRGMELALQEINDAGGINGRRVVVLYEDSQSEPNDAVSALRKLISVDHVPVVIGDIASSSVLAMAPIAEQNEVVLLSPGASNSDITNAGNYIFRNWQSDALEGRVDAEYAASSLHWNNVAVLYVNNAYGSGLSGVFSQAFTASGGRIVASEAFNQSTTDMRAQITRIAALHPDGIYLPGYPPEMATVLRQMRELSVRIPILSVQAFDDPTIIQSVGNAANGVIFSVPKPPEQSDPVVANFHRRYVEAYGEEPGVTSDTGYDALRIVADAIEQGGYSGPEIRSALTRMTNFPGAAGPTTFDTNGDVAREFEFRRIVNGNAVPATP